jgi:Peptidase family S41/Tricorn protease C1 domain
MKINQLAVFSAFLFLFSNCEKLAIRSDLKNSPTNCFDHCWTTIDQKYSFFDLKNIDWTAIGNQYRPLVTDDISEDSLFNVLNSMLFTLKDGHVNIKTPTNRTRNWTWFEDFPENFNLAVVEKNYLKKDFLVTNFLPNQWLRDSIGYVRYADFSDDVREKDIDFVINRFKNARGIIFDIRNNGGGAFDNATLLVSRFLKKKQLLLKSFQKNGVAHDAFAASDDVSVSPGGDFQFSEKPVIVLTNRKCYSSASFFAAMMGQLPNVKIIGDQTGGGGGVPTSSQLPNGWVIRYSSTSTTTADGFNFELGVLVDIRQDLLQSDENQGIDSIIERAISEI